MRTTLENAIELELWRFRQIKDHDEALEAVKEAVNKVIEIAKGEGGI